MALRSQTAFAFVFVTAAFAAEIKIEARHDRWLRDRAGTLTLTGESAAFAGKKKTIAVKWDDVQRAVLNDRFLRLITYEDVRWRLGNDREFEFRLPPDAPVAAVRELLDARLGQRLVLETSLAPSAALWTVRAKRLRAVRGAQGTLHAGAEAVVFESETRGQSLSFRYADIQTIARVSPYEFVLASLYEEHRFQLKEPLSEERFDALWERLQRHKGLKILTYYQGDNR
ncbi:MAG TPA: hypothetical protein DEH78_07035 [Solibacterales bacterium]|nr:hypothetical protein [Bryobacterales bacterium]